MREYFVTRSGLPIRIILDLEDPSPPSGATRTAFHVYMDGARSPRRVIVHVEEVGEVRTVVERQQEVDWDQEYSLLLRMALLLNAEVAHDSEATPTITVTPASAPSLLWPPRLPDHLIRVFVARRLYDEVSRSALHDPMMIDATDARLCGADPVHLLRAAQILEEEGYLDIQVSTGDACTLTAHATLIRDIERYGAPQADSTAADDLLRALSSYPVAQQRLPAIALEYARFTTSTSHQGLLSVYKAIAPELEGLARDALAAKGVVPPPENLGLIISELQSRRLGSVQVVAQLRYVHKFARDLAEHGEQLPEPVLRIACANAFAILPELAAISV